jgi:hypothetical protein
VTPFSEPEAALARRRIFWARGVRDFGDGLVAVLLPAYFLALGYGAAELGAVSTLALLGSALVTSARPVSAGPLGGLRDQGGWLARECRGALQAA